jgi:hypothetical protein
MARRPGQFDANPKNGSLSLLNRPPKNRPVAEIAPGFRFHFHHMGFDRNIRKMLGAHFDLRKTYASPLGILGTLINPEIYFVAQKIGQS